jgi:hypothetical protein
MVNEMGVSPRKLYRPGMNTKVCEARTSLRWSAWLRRKAQRENMRAISGLKKCEPINLRSISTSVAALPSWPRR